MRLDNHHHPFPELFPSHKTETLYQRSNDSHSLWYWSYAWWQLKWEGRGRESEQMGINLHFHREKSIDYNYNRKKKSSTTSNTSMLFKIQSLMNLPPWWDILINPSSVKLLKTKTLLFYELFQNIWKNSSTHFMCLE